MNFYNHGKCSLSDASKVSPDISLYSVVFPSVLALCFTSVFIKISSALSLRFVYFAVNFIGLQQFFVCTKSMNLPFIHNDDTVCILHTGYTLCNDQLCCIRDFFTECTADLRICSSIYRTGTVIQDQNLRFLKQCSCNTQSLLLTTGYVVSSLFNVGIIFIRETLDEFICTCKPDMLPYILRRSPLCFPSAGYPEYFR